MTLNLAGWNGAFERSTKCASERRLDAFIMLGGFAFAWIISEGETLIWLQPSTT